MFAKLFKKRTERQNSGLSEFVRNADASQKKKVYTRVIAKAVDSQNEVIKEAELLRSR